ncbi:DUF1566 domain-containing protein [Leptospira yasudae]|nr:DUF1566 domain-containing protein [Leptospira yasudae]
MFLIYKISIMRSLIRCFWISSALILLSCAQADKISFDSSSNAGLLLQGGLGIIRNLGSGTAFSSFSFSAKENFLSQDYPTVINGTNITATVPYGVVARLRPTFTVSADATVKVGEMTQISGVNWNDFSSPVTYTVVAGNGTKQNYTVTVSVTNPITDAGQKICYDGTLNSIPCGGSVHPNQDADFQNGPQASFVKTVFPEYSSQPVVHDKIAGLAWKYCPEGTNPVDCSGTNSQYSYASAVAACDALNAGNGYAGYKSWRIPSIQELYSISTYENPTPSPYLDVTFFPNSSQTFWSGTAVATPGSSRWTFNFTQGTSSNLSETGSLPVRCVVSGAFPAKQFVDMGDGTILEKTSNLRWAQCSCGQSGTNCSSGTLTNIARQAGLQFCANIATSDGKPWRLPNVHELRSIVEYGFTVGNGVLDTAYFKNNPVNVTYLTSSANPDPSNKNLFLMDFVYGPISLSSFLATTAAIRCVKDGP